MRPFNNALRTFALGALLAVLGGCSEYLDRRDTIALSGGNAVATDAVTHMVDPWPRESANRNIAFNGATDGRARSSAIAPTGSSRRAASVHPAPTGRQRQRRRTTAHLSGRLWHAVGGAGEISERSSCIMRIGRTLRNKPDPRGGS